MNRTRINELNSSHAESIVTSKSQPGKQHSNDDYTPVHKVTVPPLNFAIPLLLTTLSATSMADICVRDSLERLSRAQCAELCHRPSVQIVWPSRPAWAIFVAAPMQKLCP